VPGSAAATFWFCNEADEQRTTPNRKELGPAPYRRHSNGPVEPGTRDLRSRHAGADLVRADRVHFLAAGCAGGGAAHHPTLTVAQTLRQARADGFMGPVRVAPQSSLRCDTRTLEFGPSQPTGRYAAYRRPSYTLELGDRRARPRSDVAGIGMEVVVFDSARFAARCAHAGIYADEHAPVHPGSAKLWRYKVASPTTIQIGMHKPGAPGTVLGHRRSIKRRMTCRQAAAVSWSP
jgi:hypothetical protein